MEKIVTYMVKIPLPRVKKTVSSKRFTNPLSILYNHLACYCLYFPSDQMSGWQTRSRGPDDLYYYRCPSSISGGIRFVQELRSDKARPIFQNDCQHMTVIRQGRNSRGTNR